jgi:hypothetical protein
MNPSDVQNAIEAQAALEGRQPKRLSPHLRIVEVDFLKPTVRNPGALKQ